MAGISSEGSDMRPEGQGIRSHRTGRYLVKRASFVSAGSGIESEGKGIRPQRLNTWSAGPALDQNGMDRYRY